jgi:hypothetical protein
VRAGKEKALNQLKNDVEKTFGDETDVTKLLKKINNMKAEVKKKHDLKATGNKKLPKLKDWENEFLELLEAAKNPTMSCIPGE